MNNENLNKELDVIGKYMVSQIKREMTSGKIKASGDLYNSIKYSKNKEGLIVTSLDYGSVVLGEGSRPSSKTPSMEMVSRIERWMGYKGMSALARGRGGRFRKRTPSSIRSAAFNLSKRILERGIQGSNIIQTSVQRLEKRIEKDILKAYKADILRQFDETLININK